MYSIYKKSSILWFIILAYFLLFTQFPAYAQAFKDPWGFAPQNRASIAAMIRQVETERSASGAATSGTTILTCGKGESSSEANSACIIMNNSNGVLSVGQDSKGNQTSNNTKTQVESVSNADEVLATLNNGR